jgi:ribonuclease BN (tRNA processing enzyme)
MQVTILGCRGSYPVAHPSVLRYGGDTTCLQVLEGNTLVILDAGTGIRHLNAIPDYIKAVHLFITHLHWDHILGFPQWAILQTRPDLKLNLYSLARTHDKFYAALEKSISQPLYSRRWDEVFGSWKYHELLPGDHVELPDMEVDCALANHPYRALAYRIGSARRSVAFVPDTSPFDRYLFDDAIVFHETGLTTSDKATLKQRWDALLGLVAETDWLVYDAAQTDHEYEVLPHWGHSTPSQAVEIARLTSAKKLVLFHHGPNRTDDQVDALLAAEQARHPDMTILAAASGMKLE